MPDEKEIEDMFKDFEGKTNNPSKKTADKAQKSIAADIDVETIAPVDEDAIKLKYREEKEMLEQKYRDELANVKAKKVHEAIREGKDPIAQFKAERIIYLCIIAVLLIYFGFTQFGHVFSGQNNIQQGNAIVPLANQTSNRLFGGDSHLFCR